jgi:hypothetical protein
MASTSTTINLRRIPLHVRFDVSDGDDDHDHDHDEEDKENGSG